MEAKNGWKLPADQLSKLVDYILLLIDIDKKNKNSSSQKGLVKNEK